MTTFKQQLEQAAHAYAREQTKDRTWFDGHDERLMLLGFRSGARWALQSEAMKQVEFALSAEIAEVRRLGGKPLARSVEALALLRKMREGVE